MAPEPSPTTLTERFREWTRRTRADFRNEGHGQMARNFAKSMGMLAAAMISALYASSAARDGRVFTAGIGAVIAMSIAIWVGIRFVPRLAAGVDWDWLPFFTRYKLTRDGWIFIAASVVVMSAAINTGNNLLYMVLSALLAVMILSGLLSGLNFRFLKGSARLPDHCYANESFQMTISVRNPKRVFPTFSIEVQPPAGSGFEFPSYYVPLVKAGSRNTRTVSAMVRKRGRHDLEELHIRSRYPFGFLMKGRDFPVDGGIVAFPELLPEAQGDDTVRDLRGSSERFQRGQGMDLYMIREYQASDSARHLDWKASAKTARLKTREFAAEESRRVVLLFDRYGREGDAAAFERMVSRTASAAVYLVREGAEVKLVSDDWTSGAGRSEPQVEPILRYLALVEMDPAVPPPAVGDGEESLRFSLRGPAADAEFRAGETVYS